MNRSKELLVGIGMAFSLATMPACTETKDKSDNITVFTEYKDMNPRIQSLSSRILKLAKYSTTQEYIKPNYTTEFNETTAKGQIYVNAHAAKPDITPSNVDHIGIGGITESGHKFEIDLLAVKDGRWNATCLNGTSFPGKGLAEEGQRTAHLGGKTDIEDPAHANAILSGTITAASTVLDAIDKQGKEGVLIGEVCRFNLGG